MNQPLAITPGEPAGIGPDLIVNLAQQPPVYPIVVVASRELLERRAQALQIPLQLHDYRPNTPLPVKPGELFVLDVPLSAPVDPGKLDPANAGYVLQTLRLSTEACLNNEFAALVTGPVHKGVINQAGYPFTGHTEFLAQLSNTPLPVMLLMTPGLRVALATTHLPLRAVADTITPGLLENCLDILYHDLQTRFALKAPRITVCGLNPHAGEDGHLGREEINIITPVLNKYRERGWQIIGPIPADTAFTNDKMAQTDAYLAMYHDQGLTVLKHLGFGKAVNITFGLPFIRTSVDHGTALDLAATGRADNSSLLAAIDAAQSMIAAQTHDTRL